MGGKNSHTQAIPLLPAAGVSSSSKAPLLPLPKHPVPSSHPRQVQEEVPDPCHGAATGTQHPACSAQEWPSSRSITDATAFLCIQHSYPLLSCSCAHFPSCLTYTSEHHLCHPKGTEVSGSKQQAQPTVGHNSWSRKCFSSKKDLAERQESAGNDTHIEQMPAKETSGAGIRAAILEQNLFYCRQ